MVTLTGKLTDVTGRTPESISNIIVKAPSARIGGGSGIIVTSPAEVTFNKMTGDITLSGLHVGLSWLYIEGDGWSDSIALAAADGMITLVEAVANASGVPGLADFIALLEQLRQNMQDVAADEFARNSTEYVGHVANAGRNVQLGTSGKLQVLTDQVTREQDAASKGYVDAQNPYKPWIVNGSLDDYIGNGVYPVADTSVANRPENAYGTLVVTQPTGGRFMQEFTTYTTPVRRYVRTKHTNDDDWSAWSRIDSTETLVMSGDLNDLVEVGTYRIASTSVGNRPENRYGSLEVLSPTEMRTIQRFTIFHGDEPPTTHLRSLVHATGEWTEWAGSPYNSAVVDGDLDSFTNQGIFPIANLGIGNLPVDKYGTLEVMYPTRNRYIQRYTTFEVPTRQYTRTKHAGDADWSEWYDASALTRTTGVGEDIAEGTARRDLLRQHLLSLKGGRIGTGGLGAVALRFDDAPTEFVERALPLLQELRLPFSRVTTTETIGTTTIDPAVFPEMEDYCIRYGGEVWNHGRTHLDATGDENIDVEIIEPLYVLRDRMPRLNISCFAPPGGAVTYDGYMPSRTIDNWAGTRTGRRILSHHAIATGYMDHMLIRRLDGVVRDGARQWSADNFTLAFTQSIVRQLEGGGQGACLMWHMNAASDNFEAILRWIAAERDAGRLMVLTDSGLHCADSSTDYRANLLKTREFTGAAFTDVWTNTTGERWVERLQGYRGATVEIVCEVTGTAGQTVTTNICGVEMLHTLTGGEQTIRQVATIPVDASEIRFSCDGAVTQAHCWHV